MDKNTINALAQFCVEQRNAFNPLDWYKFSEIDNKAVALAAKYLSMTSWYGHEDALEKIAEDICPFAENSSWLHIESRLSDFDLPYFSSVVRFGITRAKMMADAFPASKRRRGDSDKVAESLNLR